jgi:hypothetical protein
MASAVVPCSVLHSAHGLDRRLQPSEDRLLAVGFFADVGLLYHQAGRVSLAPAEVATRLSFLGLVIVASIHLARLGPAGKLCALLANGPLGLAAFGSLVGAEIFDVRNLLEIAPFTAIVVAYAVNRLPGYAGFAVGIVACCFAVGSFVQTRSWIPPPYQEVASALVDGGWQVDEPIAPFGSIAPFPRPTQYFLPPLGWYLGAALCGAEPNEAVAGAKIEHSRPFHDRRRVEYPIAHPVQPRNAASIVVAYPPRPTIDAFGRSRHRSWRHRLSPLKPVAQLSPSRRSNMLKESCGKDADSAP